MFSVSGTELEQETFIYPRVVTFSVLQQSDTKVVISVQVEHKD